MRSVDLPSLPDKFIYRLDLRNHVTPRLLKSEPIHRWFWFPHSFSPQLLDEILKAYPQPPGAKILDPFVGAGTTVLRAKQLGYTAVGCDLSPLSIFVSQTKLQLYNPKRIEIAIRKMSLKLNSLLKAENTGLGSHLGLWANTKRIQRAFTRKEWQTLVFIYELIQAHLGGMIEKGLFLLAWLNVQQQISRAVPDGGWFRWVEKPNQSNQIFNLFIDEMNSFLSDVFEKDSLPNMNCTLYQIDSRNLSTLRGTFDLLLTSPPYPNRHDYSRVFHLALLSLGVSEAEVFSLRYHSIRSHVEARAPEDLPSEKLPFTSTLKRCLKKFPSEIDHRIPRMIKGYFEDLAFSLSAAHQVLRSQGICVLVVGNVRHAGVMVPVDEILVEIGKNVGFVLESAWVARLRGNSAQQMGKFGRTPSRESILTFRKI